MSIFADYPGPKPPLWERLVGLLIALLVNSPLIFGCVVVAREAFR